MVTALLTNQGKNKVGNAPTEAGQTRAGIQNQRLRFKATENKRKLKKRVPHLFCFYNAIIISSKLPPPRLTSPFHLRRRRFRFQATSPSSGERRTDFENREREREFWMIDRR